MSMIQVTNVSFAYEGSPVPVFDNVSFRIDTDWKLGFTGRNGRGKTTFLKLLMGEYEYSGTIRSDAVFDYFPFEVKDPSQDTILTAGEVCPDYEYWRLVKELSKLRVEEEVLFRPFKTLSQGEQTKVLLALLFLRQQHFLLIDEPTNHLDMEARQVAAEYLSRKKGFILVSHDRAFLDRAVDHMLVINKGNIEVQKGNFSSWYENKQRQDAFEMEENERLKKDIRRLKTAALRTGQWADDVEGTKLGKRNAEAAAQGKFLGTRAYIGEKSRKLQQRRKNLERRQEQALREKSELLHNMEIAEDLKLFPQRWHQERLAVFNGGRIVYRMGASAGSFFGEEASDELGRFGEDSGDAGNDSVRIVLENLHLEIRRGERLVLQGKNGSGKSSILKVLFQMAGAPEREIMAGHRFQESNYAQDAGLPEYQGEGFAAKGLKISYISQDTSGLKGSLREYAIAWGVEESLLKMVLRKLDFSRDQLELPIETFSQGQKKKVLIARSLCEQAHLYLWDEPLNYVDVYSRMQIEELILKFQPTMVLIEHDRAFAEKVADRFYLV